jgi:hypothetical protein
MFGRHKHKMELVATSNNGKWLIADVTPQTVLLFRCACQAGTDHIDARVIPGHWSAADLGGGWTAGDIASLHEAKAAAADG